MLRKYRPRVVAVTGSVGKTSTKDAIFAVLGKSSHARKSQKSFNSEVGLPLTILGVPNAWNNPLRWIENLFDGLLLALFRSRYPEWLVLEIGADRPGDIRGLASWLPVEIAVITRLPEMPVHVEYFDSPQAVVEEKASLIDCIRPGGALVLFADDGQTRGLQNRLPAPDAKIVTFGFSEVADVRGEHFKLVYEEGKESWPIGMEGHITADGTSVPITITGAIGAHAFLPALAAAAVGRVLGKPLNETVSALNDYQPPAGRMRLVAGIKDTLLIDDTYNASPAATTAGLETLGLLKVSGRKIAVLGDMLELGRHSVEEHKKLGAVAADVCDLLVVVGVRARDIAQGALAAGMHESKILQFEDSRKTGKELEATIKKGDCLYIKGSQYMRMEHAVEELMQEPSRAAELLVRQDFEWKKR